ncbi:BURP domain protein RD22 [Humulus lupulus]|uniref:BURP domain protein RD22 n=1 Tax=Humulus lupulus TaxID=3486 RepID=UPI002B40B40E|nr:BURP domain protein RD22 [Humulus lupulus]
MGFHYFTYILAFLTLVFAASHALQSPELYWKSVLPNTAMPKAVTDLLQSDIMEEKSTSVNVGKGGVNVNTGKGTKPGSSGTHVSVGKGTGVGVSTGKGTNVGVGKGGVSVSTGKKGKPPVYVSVGKGKSPFVYNYAATETQLHDNPNVALFFLEKDIQPGTEMNLNFIKSSNQATFLPRKVAQSIPFSSKQVPEILTKLSVKPQSVEAEMVKETIKECEEPSTKGEDKYCATSLESMIDFTTSKLGKNVQAVSTEVEKESGKMEKYTITQVEKKKRNSAGGSGGKTVVCHKQNYPFAVFYCHASQATEAYMVSLEGSDGTKAKAVAACHKDTSEWNPKHLAFQVLKVKPGTVPVCHFLPEDHIVWIQN